jgi:hypothetical protein
MLSIDRVILQQTSAQPAGFCAYNRVDSWVEGRFPAQHFDSDRILLQIVLSTRECALNDKAQEPGGALGRGENPAAQNLFELRLNGVIGNAIVLHGSGPSNPGRDSFYHTPRFIDRGGRFDGGQATDC